MRLARWLRLLHAPAPPGATATPRRPAPTPGDLAAGQVRGVHASPEPGTGGPARPRPACGPGRAAGRLSGSSTTAVTTTESCVTEESTGRLNSDGGGTQVELEATPAAPAWSLPTGRLTSPCWLLPGAARRPARPWPRPAGSSRRRRENSCRTRTELMVMPLALASAATASAWSLSLAVPFVYRNADEPSSAATVPRAPRPPWTVGAIAAAAQLSAPRWLFRNTSRSVGRR